jgi:tRNA(Ile)-lysidine synthase
VGPHPAVAAVRLAVRRALGSLAPGDLVLAACSGGADSLALAAALAFEGPRLGLRTGGVTVDHGLQAASAAQASRVAATLTKLGLDPVRVVSAAVAGPAGRAAHPGRDGHPGRDAHPGRAAHPGPEAVARAARYAVLDEAASSAAAAAILLGHTLDDQAETVLLGLARGSGSRSLAGMAPGGGGPGGGGPGGDRPGGARYLRPLLDIRRAQTIAACAAHGLRPWDDPHNSDPGYTRVRVRGRVLPLLEAELGPGVAEALARTARQLRADAEVLDELAAATAQRISDGQPGWPADALTALPPAIRSRLLRTAALAAGAPPGALSERHVTQVDALVTDWHGQQWVDLPGGVRCQRRCGRLLFAAVPQTTVPPTTVPQTEGLSGRE